MTLSLKRVGFWLMAVLSIMALPFIATKMSADVNWDATDFIVLASMLITAIVLYETAVRSSRLTAYRIAAAAGITGSVLLFWVNAGVGIIGNEGQVVNLLYYAVFVVGITGAILSKLDPLGMARTMYAMAVIPMAVPAVALILWPAPAISWSPGVTGVFALSVFFSLLLVASGLLFHRAANRSHVH